MSSEHKNLGNHLVLIRGGLYAVADVPPEVSMFRKVRACFHRIRDRLRGRSRFIECVAGGVTRPTLMVARAMQALKRERVSFEDAFDAIIEPEIECLCRMYGRRYERSEFRPPQAA